MVELLIAAVILAMCVVPITGTISFIRANATEAKVQSSVLNLLRTSIDSRLDGGKKTRLVQTSAPIVTNQSLAGGVSVALSLTITAVPGYTGLFAVACTATWASPTAANRTDTMDLATYAVTI